MDPPKRYTHSVGIVGRMFRHDARRRVEQQDGPAALRGRETLAKSTVAPPQGDGDGRSSSIQFVKHNGFGLQLGHAASVCPRHAQK